jgi:hypothetical protein
VPAEVPRTVICRSTAGAGKESGSADAAVQQTRERTMEVSRVVVRMGSQTRKPRDLFKPVDTETNRPV